MVEVAGGKVGFGWPNGQERGDNWRAFHCRFKLAHSRSKLAHNRPKLIEAVGGRLKLRRWREDRVEETKIARAGRVLHATSGVDLARWSGPTTVPSWRIVDRRVGRSEQPARATNRTESFMLFDVDWRRYFVRSERSWVGLRRELLAGRNGGRRWQKWRLTERRGEGSGEREGNGREKPKAMGFFLLTNIIKKIISSRNFKIP